MESALYRLLSLEMPEEEEHNLPSISIGPGAGGSRGEGPEAR